MNGSTLLVNVVTSVRASSHWCVLWARYDTHMGIGFVVCAFMCMFMRSIVLSVYRQFGYPLFLGEMLNSNKLQHWQMAACTIATRSRNCEWAVIHFNPLEILWIAPYTQFFRLFNIYERVFTNHCKNCEWPFTQFQWVLTLTNGLMYNCNPFKDLWVSAYACLTHKKLYESPLIYNSFRVDSTFMNDIYMPL